jgi:hypothetical protein
MGIGRQINDNRLVETKLDALGDARARLLDLDYVLRQAWAVDASRPVDGSIKHAGDQDRTHQRNTGDGRQKRFCCMTHVHSPLQLVAPTLVIAPERISWMAEVPSSPLNRCFAPSVSGS